MKLHQASNEFKNIESSSAAEKLKFAKQRVKSLNHQLTVNSAIPQRYKDRFVQYRFGPLRSDEAAKGYVAFERTNSNAWHPEEQAIYHSLSSNDINVLTIAYKKIGILTAMIKKTESQVVRYKLEVKKETGTYVSRKDLTEFERALQNDMAGFIMSIAGPEGFRTYQSTIKTKKSGISLVYVGIEILAKHKATVAEIALFIDMRKKIQSEIKDWLIRSGFPRNKVSFSGQSDIRTGAFAAQVITQDLIRKYRK